MIITVAAAKGGVGKSTIAWELAPLLDAVLVDFDWDGGGVTGLFDTSMPSPRIIEALESGRVPRPRRMRGRPDLVPSHPDLGSSLIEPDLVADALRVWSEQWSRPIVVDTHPGGTNGSLTDAAMAAADVVVVPTPLKSLEMRALGRFLDELPGHPFLLVPNMVPSPPPTRLVSELERLAAGRPVAPVISEHRFLARRVRRTPLVLTENPGRAVARAANQFRRLGETVSSQVSAIR